MSEWVTGEPTVDDLPCTVHVDGEYYVVIKITRFAGGGVQFNTAGNGWLNYVRMFKRGLPQGQEQQQWLQRVMSEMKKADDELRGRYIDDLLDMLQRIDKR